MQNLQEVILYAWFVCVKRTKIKKQICYVLKQLQYKLILYKLFLIFYYYLYNIYIYNLYTCKVICCFLIFFTKVLLNYYEGVYAQIIFGHFNYYIQILIKKRLKNGLKSCQLCNLLRNISFTYLFYVCVYSNIIIT